MSEFVEASVLLDSPKEIVRFLMLRRVLASAVFFVALPLAAQQPPKLEPLPEPPPPPPGMPSDQPDDSPVRIEPGSGEQIEEKVIDGKRVVHVTTSLGQEYYLIEDQGTGSDMRSEGIDRGVRVPLWVIRRF